MGRYDAPSNAREPEITVITDIGNTFFEVPSWARSVLMECVAAGGGGGSGRRGAAGTIRCGGGGGGGGSYSSQLYDASDLDSTLLISIGAPGVGGAAITVNDTDGNPGTTGGLSEIRNADATVRYCRAQGPGGGGGGTNAGSAGGIASVGMFFGGAGAAGPATGAIPLVAGTVSGGAGGGGAGGGITAADVPSAGSNGAFACVVGYSVGIGGAINTDGGQPPLSPVVLRSAIRAAGSGGGGASIVGPAGMGGAGIIYGAGGGGGGASLNGNNSGAGGDGGPAIVVITVYG